MREEKFHHFRGRNNRDYDLLKFDITDSSGRMQITLWNEDAVMHKGKYIKGDVIKLKGVQLKIDTKYSRDNRWELTPMSRREFKLKKRMLKFYYNFSILMKYYNLNLAII